MTLTFKLEFSPDTTTVKLSGAIDEHAAGILDAIRRQVVGRKVRFDCEKITMINSIGAANWISAIHEYGDRELTFSRCPHAFTGLCLLINDFTSGGRIESLYVRYRCEGCPRGSLKTLLVQREAALTDGQLKPQRCPHCGNTMNPEEDDQDLIEVFRDPDAA